LTLSAPQAKEVQIYFILFYRRRCHDTVRQAVITPAISWLLHNGSDLRMIGCTILGLGTELHPCSRKPRPTEHVTAKGMCSERSPASARLFLDNWGSLGWQGPDVVFGRTLPGTQDATRCNPHLRIFADPQQLHFESYVSNNSPG
jgi:hypothetical protein